MGAGSATSARGFWQVAAGAVLLSFAAVFVKLARVGPTPAGFYRMLVGAVVLFALAVVRRERLWAGGRAAGFALAAGACFTLDLVFWHRSIHLVGPGLATILANFQVFLLAGFGLAVLRERLTWRLLIAIPLALLGLFLLVGVDWSLRLPPYRLGVVLGLLTALAYGSFLLVLRASQARPQRLEPVPNLLLLCVATTALLGVSTALEGESLRVPDAGTGLVLVAYGVTAQVVGWLLISRGIAHVEAARVGLILLLQPALAFVWDMLFFARPTDVGDLAGAMLALGAIYFGARRAPGGSAVGRGGG
ncbi:MAG: DMT family transporter [Gemmatimonadota bacterium]|nr:DMT family transporter [Gemmatimonadota bacterium]